METILPDPEQGLVEEPGFLPGSVVPEDGPDWASSEWAHETEGERLRRLHEMATEANHPAIDPEAIETQVSLAPVTGASDSAPQLDLVGRAVLPGLQQTRSQRSTAVSRLHAAAVRTADSRLIRVCICWFQLGFVNSGRFTHAHYISMWATRLAEMGIAVESTKGAQEQLADNAAAAAARLPA